MFKDFREFAFKGNVLDLAVGVIIGGAFGTIVKSLVEDVITPIIARIAGRLDFSNWFFTLDGSTHATLKIAREKGAPLVAYGSFLTALIQFLILAAVVYYCIVKPANKLRLSGAEEKTDFAAKNVEQNERIIELLEKSAGKA